MTDSFINTLKQLYINASVPVVIAGKDLGILWRNTLSELSPGIPEEEVLREHLSRSRPSGLIRKTSGGVVYCFNVFQAEDPSDKNNIYYIIETVDTEKHTVSIDNPDVRDFVTYLCSKIRLALENITRTADELFDAVSVGDINGEKITGGLNLIDRSIMSVAKEVIQPEQLYHLLDKDGKTATLSMDSELRNIIGEVKSFFGNSVSVSGDCPKHIFFRMNRIIFETVIAEMTAECCGSELFPDMLVYAVKRTDANRAEISVRSVNTSGNPNTAYDFSPREADIRGVNRHVFFDHVCSVLAEQNGAVFNRSVLPDGILYKMELDVLPKGSAVIAMTSADYFSEEVQRFGVIAMSLADFYHTERYHYIDPSRIDNNCSDKE
ncbi:MAG: hypothetical protein J1E40_12565 [Oscillospiraceae bacterium]|nr:hypothetical protein [Oscillospiraceae bacterium]